MSLEQAITDHASALRELAAAIRSTISGAHDITAATDKVIRDAKKADTPAAGATTQATGAVEGSDAKKSADTQTAATTAKAGAARASPSDVAQVDYEAVKAKVLALSKAQGREPTVALLQRYGVDKAPELKPEQYAGFIADADRVIAGTYDPVAAAAD